MGLWNTLQVTRLRKSLSEDKMRAEGLQQKQAQNLQEIDRLDAVKEKLEEDKKRLKVDQADAASNSEELDKELAAMEDRRKILHMLLNGDDINAKLTEELRQLE